MSTTGEESGLLGSEYLATHPLMPLDKMANRIVGVGVIPYPPGIPIVMPGENIGPADGPWISFLRALLEWGRAFPGFAKEVEGTIEKDETYWVYCLKK